MTRSPTDEGACAGVDQEDEESWLDPPKNDVERLMIVLARTHDQNVGRNEHGAEIAIRAGNGLAVPYWEALAMAALEAPAISGEQQAGGAFVAGPTWKLDESSEDGGELWESEVQSSGGYSVIATVCGGSEEEANARRDAILTALSAPVDRGEAVAWRIKDFADGAWVSTVDPRMADYWREAGTEVQPLYLQGGSNA